MDPGSGELRKSGVRIKLRNQPFTLLPVLLEHAGEIVSPRTFSGLIWGAESVVDFDICLGWWPEVWALNRKGCAEDHTHFALPMPRIDNARSISQGNAKPSRSC